MRDLGRIGAEWVKELLAESTLRHAVEPTQWSQSILLAEDSQAIPVGHALSDGVDQCSYAACDLAEQVLRASIPEGEMAFLLYEDIVASLSSPVLEGEPACSFATSNSGIIFGFRGVEPGTLKTCREYSCRVGDLAVGGLFLDDGQCELPGLREVISVGRARELMASPILFFRSALDDTGFVFLADELGFFDSVKIP